MKRIAIVGGGISGLATAYELERARLVGAEIDWQLYEAGARLGGIVETTRVESPYGEFILESGPDGWVSEKPWARDLAIELGLEDQLIHSNDAARKTYILLDNKLQPIPDRMRLMVPEDLRTLEDSPLFSTEARRAYAAELSSAAQLKHNAPNADESVASFIRRHFDHEVLRKLATPLLSGVFGGDVETLSVRAVMPQFVAMEREHGSLIAALQAKAAAHGDKPPQPIFTTLRNGLGSLIDALVAKLPPARLHLRSQVRECSRARESGWILRIALDSVRGCANRYVLSDRLILATPLDITRRLLRTLDYAASALLPKDASSAVLTSTTFIWPAEAAQSFTHCRKGFGFLVPPTASRPDHRSFSPPPLSIRSSRIGLPKAPPSSAPSSAPAAPNNFSPLPTPKSPPPHSRSSAKFLVRSPTPPPNSPPSAAGRAAFPNTKSAISNASPSSLGASKISATSRCSATAIAASASLTSSATRAPPPPRSIVKQIVATAPFDKPYAVQFPK